MSYIVPVQELKIEDVRLIEETARLAVLSELAKKLGVATAADIEAMKARVGVAGTIQELQKTLVVREILPKTDLGLTNEEWKISYTAAYTWETKVSKLIKENTCIGFYSITNLSAVPKTLFVRLGLPGLEIAIWNWEKLYTYAENVTGYTLQPVIVLGGKTLQIDFYGNATGDDFPAVRGFLCEPKGEVITPEAGK